MISMYMYYLNCPHTLEQGKESDMAMCVKNRPNSEELYASLVSPTKGGREGDGESFHTHLEWLVQNGCVKRSQIWRNSYFQSTYVPRKGLNHN